MTGKRKGNCYKERDDIKYPLFSKAKNKYLNENGIEVSQSESFLTGKEKMAKKSAPRFGRYTQILIIEKRSWYRPLSLIITNIMSTQSLLKTDNFRLLFFQLQFRSAD